METTAVVTKDVRLIFTRPRAEIQVQLERGDTCTDALNKADKDANDYYILNPKTQVEFQPTEELWEHVQDGGKFHVVPQSEVAGSSDFVGWVRRAFGLPSQPSRPARKSRPHQRLTSTYAREMGWTRGRDGGLNGYFRAHGLRWRGQVHPGRRSPRFLIENPPIPFIKASPHSACFHAQGRNWWLVHVADSQGRDASDVDSGISAVNRLLTEVFRPGNRRSL